MENQMRDPWIELSQMLAESGSASDLEAFLDELGPAATLHTVFSLNIEDQRALLSALTPHRAASLVDELPDGHVADLIEDVDSGCRPHRGGNGQRPPRRRSI